MTKKTFEELFPSLKNKYAYVKMPRSNNLSNTLAIYRPTFEKNCVDKQQVKEAIKTVRERIEKADNNRYRDELNYLGADALDDLEIELGLGLDDD